MYLHLYCALMENNLHVTTTRKTSMSNFTLMDLVTLANFQVYGYTH